MADEYHVSGMSDDTIAFDTVALYVVQDLQSIYQSADCSRHVFLRFRIACCMTSVLVSFVIVIAALSCPPGRGSAWAPIKLPPHMQHI